MNSDFRAVILDFRAGMRKGMWYFTVPKPKQLFFLIYFFLYFTAHHTPNFQLGALYRLTSI